MEFLSSALNSLPREETIFYKKYSNEINVHETHKGIIFVALDSVQLRGASLMPQSLIMSSKEQDAENMTNKYV